MQLQCIALPTELPSHLDRFYKVNVPLNWRGTVPTGLEPVISCVTGRRPNQLDHGTI